jgi:hypothetical protein
VTVVSFQMPTKGGNITFGPGKGYPTNPEVGPSRGGDIIFNLADGSEFMRIDDNGQVYIQKRRVASDLAVYQGFRHWLKHAHVIS